MDLHWLTDSAAWATVRSLSGWLTPQVLIIVSIASLAMFLASVFVTPLLLIRMPADYFLRDKPHLWTRLKTASMPRRVVLLVKNVFGVFFVALGILLIFLPGQGLLTILVGIFLLDFHGKKELERKIISRPRVRQAINWVRRRNHRPDLILEDADAA